ncbi:MAG TPA: hypothetical protein PLB31_04430 [Fimbriimonadaceae bacterium]|nr:hypothetical protein [Armatimonadota bacterium]HRD31295.1 hypothetical protein [Fimbriimonadaceae bacterium]HRE93772.1 hypothetical protein [Fimbriimonadaceae bacterium]HRI73700.1 hypothetical protein [Fimbriimonadaceae bacterium]
MALLHPKTLGTGLLALGIATVAVAAIQSTRVLIINGREASQDVRIINGRAYAPIADVAKALGSTVVINGNRYEITRAGGTNQVNGLQGKTGDWLFDGGWRFRVNNAYEADVYEAKNDWYGDNEFKPEGGKTMIIVEYSARNGNKEMFGLDIGPTTIVGKDGSSYKVESNDFPFDGTRMFSQPLLPGAQLDGALIFFVPRGFEFKELVLGIGDLAGYDDAVRPKERTYFRVRLTTDE